MFGLNDFDETLPGPFEWDLKRLVASFAVAGRDRGFDTGHPRERSTGPCLARTGWPCGRWRRRKRLDLWYARLDIEEIRERMLARKSEAGARSSDSSATWPRRARRTVKAFKKLVEIVDGQPRLVGDPPLIVPLDQLLPDVEHDQVSGALRGMLQSYRRSLQGDHRHLIDGFQVRRGCPEGGGRGQRGHPRLGRPHARQRAQDALFLQAKEAQPSVLEPFLGKSRYANSGQRVVEGQRLMQSTSDILLGWTRTDGLDGTARDYYVRQLWDGKGSALVEAMKPSAMEGLRRTLRLDACAGTCPLR